MEKIKASEIINEFTGYLGGSKELYSGMINYLYHRSGREEAGVKADDNFDMLFRNEVANHIVSGPARNGLIEAIHKYDDYQIIFDADDINIGFVGLTDREGEKSLKEEIEALKLSYSVLVENMRKSQNNMVDNTKDENILKNENNSPEQSSLEQSSLEKASEMLKNMQFTPENWKKLVNVINEISEMNGSENIPVPAEEEIIQKTENEAKNTIPNSAKKIAMCYYEHKNGDQFWTDENNFFYDEKNEIIYKQHDDGWTDSYDYIEKLSPKEFIEKYSDYLKDEDYDFIEKVEPNILKHLKTLAEKEITKNNPEIPTEINTSEEKEPNELAEEESIPNAKNEAKNTIPNSAKKIAMCYYEHKNGDQFWTDENNFFYDEKNEIIYKQHDDGWTDSYDYIEKLSPKEFIEKYSDYLKDEDYDFIEKVEPNILKHLKTLAEKEITKNNPEIPTEINTSEEKEPNELAEGESIPNAKENIELPTIEFGKTVLPAFIASIDKNPHSFENAIVMSFDKETQTYLVDNGSEKLELPKKTFDTIFNDKIEQEEKIKRAEGRTIVFEDKENGIKGTEIPEWSMYTQNGLETFKGFILQKYNQSEDTYTLSNGDKTIKVTSERFKEITKPERWENKFDENSPAYMKLCEQEYKDYFEPRENVAYNFRHNLTVLCRKEANSPCDALRIAKVLVSKMNPEERKQTEKLIKSIAHENESTNEVIARIYHDAIKEQPINEDYIKKNNPNAIIAVPFYDTISDNGKKIDNDPALIKGSDDRNLKVGDTLDNINIQAAGLFGKRKDNMHFDSLKIVSASKEGNCITVMDSNKSFMTLPLDEVLAQHKKQQERDLKHQRKPSRSQGMSFSYA